MCQRTVFLESFDSTRATSNDSIHHPNRAQAQTEALLYLLLGRSLAVNNAYGMDSVSVLELVDAVLSTHTETVKGTKDLAARHRLLEARPFIVSWFGADNLLSACAEQLRRVESGSKFRLSGWGPINDDVQQRLALADVLTSVGGDPQRPPKVPAWLERDLAERFEILARLAEYTGKNPDAGFKSRAAHIQLHDYLGYFTDLGTGDVEELAIQRACPPDIAMRMREEIIRQRDLVDIGKRGWAHDLVLGSSSDNLQEYEQIREFVDTLYNAVLAESAETQIGYMSSVPRSDAREQLKQANALALEVIRRRRLGPQPVQQQGQLEAIAPIVSGVFTAADTLPSLPVTALRHLFTRYWALVADGGRWPSWQKSCTRLNGLLESAERRRARNAKLPPDRQRDSPVVDTQLREAWAAHVTVLQTFLPDTLRCDGESVAVGAPLGANDYAQVLQIHDLAPQVLADALAVGEHLSAMATAVAE